jgi:hypothetical protein
MPVAGRRRQLIVVAHFLPHWFDRKALVPAVIAAIFISAFKRAQQNPLRRRPHLCRRAFRSFRAFQNMGKKPLVKPPYRDTRGAIISRFDPMRAAGDRTDRATSAPRPRCRVIGKMARQDLRGAHGDQHRGGQCAG